MNCTRAGCGVAEELAEAALTRDGHGVDGAKVALDALVDSHMQAAQEGFTDHWPLTSRFIASRIDSGIAGVRSTPS